MTQKKAATAAKLEAVENVDDDVEQTTDDAKPDAIALAPILFREHTFHIAVDMDEWDTEACIAISDGNYVLAAKLLLGQGQWALLQSLGSKRKDIREFLTVFANVIAEDVTG